MKGGIRLPKIRIGFAIATEPFRITAMRTSKNRLKNNLLHDIAAIRITEKSNLIAAIQYFHLELPALEFRHHLAESLPC